MTPITGKEIDPAEQAVIATEHLKALTSTLGAASDRAETGQSAINSQGYNPKGEES